MLSPTAHTPDACAFRLLTLAHEARAAAVPVAAPRRLRLCGTVAQVAQALRALATTPTR